MNSQVQLAHPVIPRSPLPSIAGIEARFQKSVKPLDAGSPR